MLQRRKHHLSFSFKERECVCVSAREREGGVRARPLAFRETNQLMPQDVGRTVLSDSMNPVVRLTCGGFAAFTVTTPIDARLLKAGIDLRALLPPIIIARGERQREGKRFASSKAGKTCRRRRHKIERQQLVPARRPDARTARNPKGVAANERKGF